MNSTLIWGEQFSRMKMKLIESIKKLMVIQMNLYQAHIYFSIYMIRSTYFGYGIFELSDKQEKELMLIYKRLLLKKLGLGKKS